MAIRLMGRRALKQRTLPDYDYIGYDSEALGLFCDTDQPVQAAFVKLDPDFHVTRSLNLKIMRNPYAVPGPKALEVTGLRPACLHSSDRMTEFDAARKIANVIGKSPTVEAIRKKVFFGYNILSYDEGLLRYFLFRNLQDVYLTTGKNERRLDLFPAFQYLHFVSPGLIKPGRKEDGSISWKLSDVMAANGLIAENAHDAEADTMMTADLLILFVQRAQSVFEMFVNLSDKRHLSKMLSEHMHGSSFVMEFSHFGSPEVTPLAPMARVGLKGHKTLGVDLAIHPREWMEMSAEEIAANLYKADSPFRVVKHNACPIIASPDDVRLRARLEQMRYRCDYELFERRASYIRRPDVVEKFQQVTQIMEAENREKFGGRKVARESELYNKFVSDADRNLCRIISREEEWDQRMKQIGKLTDPRLRDFAGRLVAMHAPEECVCEEHLLALREQYAIRLNDDDESGTVQTIAIAEKELENVSDPALREECADMLKGLRKDFKEEIELIDACVADMRAVASGPEDTRQLDLGLFK